MNGSDLEAIIALKYTYGQVIDRLVREGPAAGPNARSDDLRAVFTTDVVLDLTEIPGMPPMAGIEAVITQFSTVMPGALHWMWHAFHNPLITIDGDRASGEWLLSAYSIGKDQPDAPPVGTVGRYLDEYVRTADGWRTSRVKFKLGARFRTQPC
jgi:hypothetical protein